MEFEKDGHTYEVSIGGYSSGIPSTRLNHLRDKSYISRDTGIRGDFETEYLLELFGNDLIQTPVEFTLQTGRGGVDTDEVSFHMHGSGLQALAYLFDNVGSVTDDVESELESRGYELTGHRPRFIIHTSLSDGADLLGAFTFSGWKDAYTVKNWEVAILTDNIPFDTARYQKLFTEATGLHPPVEIEELHKETFRESFDEGEVPANGVRHTEAYDDHMKATNPLPEADIPSTAERIETALTEPRDLYLPSHGIFNKTDGAFVKSVHAVQIANFGYAESVFVSGAIDHPVRN